MLNNINSRINHKIIIVVIIIYKEKKVVATVI